MISGLPLEGLRVLVIEDEAFLALELIDNLEAAGAVPLGPIGTVEKALSFVQGTDRIDAAVLNVMLHRREAFPVADELRRRSVPFVFVTGNDKAVRMRFPDVPVHPKPADMAKIVLTLASVIAERCQTCHPSALTGQTRGEVHSSGLSRMLKGVEGANGAQ